MSDRALELACASLTIMESLLLELKEKGILSSEESTGLLEDARDAHGSAPEASYTDFHQRIARIINLLANGCDATNLCRDLDKLEQEKPD